MVITSENHHRVLCSPLRLQTDENPKDILALGLFSAADGQESMHGFLRGGQSVRKGCTQPEPDIPAMHPLECT